MSEPSEFEKLQQEHNNACFQLGAIVFQESLHATAKGELLKRLADIGTRANEIKKAEATKEEAK